MSSDTFVISSSWHLKNSEHKLDNTVSMCYTQEESATIESIVQLERCVQLCNSDSQDTTCSVTIKLNEASSSLISKISLVSEARLIEVYGPSGEYFVTVNAEYVDDFEDCAVYIADVNIMSSPEVLLKFARMKHAGQMWLYGIRLQLVQNSSKVIPNIANINFKNVNDRLKDSSCQLSDKAERCKKFLQSYGLSEYKNGADPQIMLKMLEAQCLTQLKPLGETGRNVSKCLSNLIPPLLSNKEDLAGSKHVIKNGSGMNGTTNMFDMQELKRYIDCKFHELEKNVLLKVENRMEELEMKQNEKLNSIISLLNDIKNQTNK